MPTKTKDTVKQITTPTGMATYPFLTRPNTKFDPDGEYKVNVILPLDEAKGLMKEIDEAMNESFEKAKSENPKKAKGIRLAKPPYTEVTDDDGNETGEVQFGFKMKAKITPRNGGQPFEVKPAIYDAAGKPIPPTELKLASGSKVKVCADLIPFFTDLVGAGITLRLKAVQVIELVEYQGVSADRFGFGAEEGYTFGSNETTDTEGVDNEADF